MTEANCHARLNCLKQLLDDVIFIQFNKKSYDVSYTKNFNRMTDCCNKERQWSKTLSSLCATVTDDVLKLGYTSVIFLDVGAKVAITVTCFCHSSCCLPYVMSLASLYFRKQCHNINISQGCVATSLRCGGICSNLFIANFLLSVTVKEFLKKIILLLKYSPEYTAYFFEPPCTHKKERSHKTT